MMPSNPKAEKTVRLFDTELRKNNYFSPTNTLNASKHLQTFTDVIRVKEHPNEVIRSPIGSGTGGNP